VTTARSPRGTFRVLVRRRTVGQGAPLVDVQLQVVATGALVWARTFSDPLEAEGLVELLERDLDELDDADFRVRHGVPAS
jgi:hypothetical protein